MAARSTVIVPDNQFPDEGLVERETAGTDFSIVFHKQTEPDALPQDALAACDGLMVWIRMAVNHDLMRRLENCKVIVRAGVGFDHIDLEAAAALGLPVCNTPDYGTSEVADHAMALLLALRRGLPSYHDQMRADAVENFDSTRAPLVRRVRGTRLGLVGLGRIGTATALRAKAFGFEVLAYDPYLPSGQEIAVGVRRVASIQELASECDAISLHAPLTPETRHIVDAAVLEAMRPHAVLVNTARGGLIDLGALAEALRAGQIGGAGIDVLPQEPPAPTEPLIAAYTAREDWTQGRLIITPHAAWHSPESRHDCRRLATEIMVMALREGRLRNCVNGHLLDAKTRRM